MIYPDHDSAWDLIFNRGKWDQVYFVYDEDDDCHRWERVELYDPRDPFKVGWNKGGIDHNKQSDAAGDRGEWDLDNSGNGQLYMGKFDGRVAIITGGGKGGGIGYGLSTAFAKEGCNLVITGRNTKKLDDAKEELERLYGVKVLACQADGGVEEQVAASSPSTSSGAVRSRWWVQRPG